MSSYPSSTCATDGSVKSSAPHSESSSSSTSSSSNTTEQTARIDTYVKNAINANPQYQYATSQASATAHSTGMKAYLDSFDAVMNNENKK